MPLRLVKTHHLKYAISWCENTHKYTQEFEYPADKSCIHISVFYKRDKPIDKYIEYRGFPKDKIYEFIFDFSSIAVVQFWTTGLNCTIK